MALGELNYGVRFFDEQFRRLFVQDTDEKIMKVAANSRRTHFRPPRRQPDPDAPRPGLTV